MIQELAQNADMQWLSILSMFIFLSFFCTMAVVVVRGDKKKFSAYGEIPLNDAEPVEK